MKKIKISQLALCEFSALIALIFSEKLYMTHMLLKIVELLRKVCSSVRRIRYKQGLEKEMITY